MINALSGSYDRSERPAPRAPIAARPVVEAGPRTDMASVEPLAEAVVESAEPRAPPQPPVREHGRGRVSLPLLGRLPLRRVIIIAAWLVFAAVSGWHRLAGLDPGRVYVFAVIMVPMAGFLGFVLCGSLGERTRRPVPRLPWCRVRRRSHEEGSPAVPQASHRPTKLGEPVPEGGVSCGTEN